MRRRVEAEWLDTLPADDPRAIRSRRDLRRVNGLMGNARIVSREIRRAFPRGLHRIAEIGAGDGAFAARLAAAVGRRAEMTLVDRQDCMSSTTARDLAAGGIEARVVRADVFDWLRQDAHERHDVIVANLFLHHFENGRLAELLALVARRTRHFIACEPRRSSLALAGSRALGLIGCNDVTRHDAVASVRAGFTGGELGAAWPRADGWSLTERARTPFSHCFVARRP